MKRPRYLGPGAPVFFVEDEVPSPRRGAWIVGGILTGLVVLGACVGAWRHERSKPIG